MMDLVSAKEGLVQAAHEIRYAIGRIQTLVRIHLGGVVGIRGNLPTADVDRFQASGYLLHGLVAGHGAQGGSIGFRMEKAPKALSAESRKRVFDVYRTAQSFYVTLTVGALDSCPARIRPPLCVQIQRSAIVASHFGISSQTLNFQTDFSSEPDAHTHFTPH